MIHQMCLKFEYLNWLASYFLLRQKYQVTYFIYFKIHSFHSGGILKE